MSTVYTQRFLMVAGEGGAGVYTVPAGHRAVIRCLTVYDGASATGRGVLWIGANPIVARTPGATQSVALELWLAVYAGENLSLTTYGTSTAASCTGYIFADTTGPIGTQRDVERGQVVAPLPAAA